MQMRRAVASNDDQQYLNDDDRGVRKTALAALGVLILTAGAAAADEAAPTSALSRQSLDDAWWTGPILAASANTLPQGHFLVEPYVYDVIAYDHYDAEGTRRSTARTNGFGSLTYVLYGLTDKLTIGAIPTFGFNDISQGKDSSGIGLGDFTVQAQYRLTKFREGNWLPTTSVVLQETVPTGKYDRLGTRASDGLGGGAYTTTVALYSQYYFWLPNGRILRTRLNLAQSFSDDASIEDVSVYGTQPGFRGRASPGDSFTVNSSWEYSLTQNWVLALDIFYQYGANTRVSGDNIESVGGERVAVQENSGSNRRFGFAPAIEYNWSGSVGVIIGARWIAAGRNADATITPVAAINLVY
jgi:hypothetical protein